MGRRRIAGTHRKNLGAVARDASLEASSIFLASSSVIQGRGATFAGHSALQASGQKLIHARGASLVAHSRLIGLAPAVPGNKFTNARSGAIYTLLQDAIDAAISGDTINVAVGTYTSSQLINPSNGTVVINKNLTIKSEVAGTKAVFTAALGGDTAIITVSAGITYNLTDLTIRDNKFLAKFNPGVTTLGTTIGTLTRCLLTENSNGILTGLGDHGTTTLIDCELVDNGDNDALSHNCYVSADTFIMRGCWSHMSKNAGDYVDPAYLSSGHLVKTRAKTILIEACRLTMEAGNPNRCIDASNGGDMTIRGNLFEYKTQQNSGLGQVIGFDLEHDLNPVNDGRIRAFRFEQNTVVNHNSTNAQFLKVRTFSTTDGIIPQMTTYVIQDNVFSGQNMPLVAQDAQTSYPYSVDTTTLNSLVALSAFVDHTNLNLKLTTSIAGSQNWVSYLYVHPASTVSRADALRGADFTVPYGLPNAGEVVAITAANGNEFAVRPSYLTTNGQVVKCLYGYFGGGTLVEDWSAFGAYCITDSGGHTASPNLGTFMFDFSDANWKYVHNANQRNTAGSGVNGDFLASEMSGMIINGTDPPMPAPAHLYANMTQRRTSAGGGPKGSVIIGAGLYANVDSSQSLQAAYSHNLSTQVLTRLSSNTWASSPGEMRFMCYDTTNNKYYLFGWDPTDIRVLDGTTLAWSSLGVARNGFPLRTTEQYCYDSVRRIVLARSGQRITDPQPLQPDAAAALSLANVGAGWTVLNVTNLAAWPMDDNSPVAHSDGRFYHYAGLTGSGNNLVRISPVGSGNVLTGQWIVDTVTLAGAGMDYAAFDGTDQVAHHSRFFRVPALDCLSWIPGTGSDLATKKVKLLKPPKYTYTSSFALTESAISEGGRWINGGATGLQWTNVSTGLASDGATRLAFGNKSVTTPSPPSSHYDDSIACLSGFSANHSIQGTIFRGAGAAAEQEVELLLRWNITANSATGYEVDILYDGRLYLVRWNGPLDDFTILAGPISGGTPVTNAVWFAQIVGTTITVKCNGVTLLTYPNATEYTSGNPGIGFYRDSTLGVPGANNTFGWKSITASEI